MDAYVIIRTQPLADPVYHEDAITEVLAIRKTMREALVRIAEIGEQMVRESGFTLDAAIDGSEIYLSQTEDGEPCYTLKFVLVQDTGE